MSGQQDRARSHAPDQAPPSAARSRQVGDRLPPGGVAGMLIQRQPIDVAPPEDEHEAEAERIADMITRSSPPPAMPAAASAPEAIWRAAADDAKKKEMTAPPVAAAPGKKKDEPMVARTPALIRRAPTDDTKKKNRSAAPVAVPPEKTKDEPMVARRAEGADATAPSTSAPASTSPPALTGGRLSGGGRTLPAETRSYFEDRLGHDLAAVRIHDDAPAAAAARDVKAQAFTYGQDVYFAQGRFQPHTDVGRHLLGHELVHTMQQRPGASLHRRAVQRQPAPAGGASTPGATGAAPTAGGANARSLPLSTGRLEGEGENKKIHFDTLEIPAFKGQPGTHRSVAYNARKPLRQLKSYDRGSPDQRKKWREGVAADQAAQGILSSKPGAEPAAGQPWLFKGPAGNPPPYFFGPDLATVATAMNLPTWDRGGGYHRFDVDHIVELQLAGWASGAPEWANAPAENMELLDSAKNRSSGSTIAQNVNRRLDAFVTAARGDADAPPSAAIARRDCGLEFDAVTGAGGPAVGPNDFWQYSEIMRGDHLAKAEVAHLSELGTAGKVKVFPSPIGGVARQFDWSGANQPDSDERDYLKPYRLTRKEFRVGAEQLSDPVLGVLTFAVPANDPRWEGSGSQTAEIRRVQGLPYAGVIDKNAIRSSLRALRKKGASPIEIDEPEVAPAGLHVTGRILPDLPVLRGGIDFELLGNDLRVFKQFSIGDIAVPRPLVVNDVTLIASAGTESGLQLSGQIDFGIERVGRGMLRAQTGTAHGIEIDGSFDFDTKLFDPARISIGYHEGAWSGAGDLGIPDGKAPGIKRADVHVAYAEGRLDASGTGELKVPGVERGAMTLTFSEAEGLAIGGSFRLKSDTPGIKSGQIEARVQERSEQGDYRVTAHGEAEPAIPGIDSRITVDYDDGAITIDGSAAYARGPVSGTLRIGATNRPVDEAGNVVPDGAPSERMTAYGGGSVTIQLTPWLQGTAAMRVLRNGEVELAGSIGLPSSIELFPEKSYERNILHIGLDIPIVGVSVLGQRIGIFATIQGGLDFSAAVGPGQLQQLGLTVTFNPDHLDQTHLTGGAMLHIPAHAGLRLFVRGGLGAGIPVVSATAGLEVGGALGLEGAVNASVNVDWMPTRGLVLDAMGEIFVEPVFRFDVTGYVLVEADLLLTTVELYSKRWRLAAIEYGSGLRLGMRFPIHYEEGRPFEMSWNDVQWQIPDVDPMAVLSGLIERIA